jgi:hypothetical protein
LLPYNVHMWDFFISWSSSGLWKSYLRNVSATIITEIKGKDQYMYLCRGITGQNFLIVWADFMSYVQEEGCSD